MFRRGQAMVETVLAVLIITSIFLVLFRLSHMLTGKILLEHAAMRVARARAVGYNDFMCLKAARVAVIPIAGKRIRPDELGSEAAASHIYLRTPDGTRAKGLLDYEKWDDLVISGMSSDGKSIIALKTDWFDLTGEAEVVPEYPFYMLEGGR